MSVVAAQSAFVEGLLDMLLSGDCVDALPATSELLDDARELDVPSVLRIG